MLEPWRKHYSNPLVPLAGIAIFVIILLGFVSVLKNSKSETGNWKLKAFAILFLFAFTMLATATFPFSFLDDMFRKFPLFNQAFRFPFTKFNSLAALTYSVMLAFGLYYLLEKFRSTKAISYLLITISSLLILWIALPAFRGHLFYEKETVKIPNEYFQTFDYFKKQDANARIANLPQPSFWGWTQYNWGPGGSGFLWYGIRQPILDRAFDVWSKASENYYYELSSALYSKDKKALLNVLNKYQISFLLLDKNVTNPPSPRALFYGETEDLLSAIPQIHKGATFGNIEIYKVNLSDKPSSFVFSTSNLPSVQIPFWKNTDQAYVTLGNYASVKCQMSIVNCQVYPFSLFSEKDLKENNKIQEKASQIIINSSFTAPKDSVLNVPNFSDNIIAATFSKKTDSNGNLLISATVKTPQILLDGKKVFGAEKEFPLFKLSKPAFPITVSINGLPNITINEDSKDTIGTTFLSSLQTNQIVIVGAGAQARSEASISEGDYSDLFERIHEVKVRAGYHKIDVIVPKIDDSYLSLKTRGVDGKFESCNSFRNGPSQIIFTNGSADITTTNSSRCISYYSQTLFHDQAYAIFINAQNLTGNSLNFWVLNEDEKSSPMSLFLGQDLTKQAFILPSMEENGQGYSFHFDQNSIGNDVSHNIINSIAAYPMPAGFINNIYIGNQINIQTGPSHITWVTHPNESFYEVQLSSNKTPSTLILSQAYDPGWQAYIVNKSNPLTSLFPYVFGKRIQSHLEANSWENAWEIDPRSNVNDQMSIVILYLPQYLEYTGFAILLIYILTLLFFGRNRTHSA